MCLMCLTPPLALAGFLRPIQSQWECDVSHGTRFTRGYIPRAPLGLKSGPPITSHDPAVEFFRNLLDIPDSSAMLPEQLPASTFADSRLLWC